MFDARVRSGSSTGMDLSDLPGAPAQLAEQAAPMPHMPHEIFAGDRLAQLDDALAVFRTYLAALALAPAHDFGETITRIAELQMEIAAARGQSLPVPAAVIVAASMRIRDSGRHSVDLLDAAERARLNEMFGAMWDVAANAMPDLREVQRQADGAGLLPFAEAALAQLRLMMEVVQHATAFEIDIEPVSRRARNEAADEGDEADEADEAGESDASSETSEYETSEFDVNFADAPVGFEDPVEFLEFDGFRRWRTTQRDLVLGELADQLRHLESDIDAARARLRDVSGPALTGRLLLIEGMVKSFVEHRVTASGSIRQIFEGMRFPVTLCAEEASRLQCVGGTLRGLLHIRQGAVAHARLFQASGVVPDLSWCLTELAARIRAMPATAAGHEALSVTRAQVLESVELLDGAIRDATGPEGVVVKDLAPAIHHVCANVRILHSQSVNRMTIIARKHRTREDCAELFGVERMVAVIAIMLAALGRVPGPVEMTDDDEKSD